MFGLFKKKEKPAAAPASAQSGEMRAFAANFHPKEMTVLVVTGAKGFASDKAADEELWTASMELTAWMEDNSPNIQRGEFKLVAKGDETLMNFLRQRVPRDFILKCRVRLSLDGTSLLLTNLPEPGFEPDLKAILEEQKKPVAVEVEGLGKFMLNRSVGVLQAEIQFMGQGVQLCFDKDEDRAACGRTAKAVLDDLIALDEKARSLAADKLLELANEWAADADGEEVSREEFLSRMTLETIDVAERESYDLWYNDGELFFGHVIHVSGNLNEGVTDARMEG